MFFYLMSILLELIGLSLIIPYMKEIQEPQGLEQYQIWGYLQAFSALNTHAEILIFSSFIIFLLFAVKILLNASIQKMIIDFSDDLQGVLQKRLAKAYIRLPYFFHTQKRSSEIINIMPGHISQFSKGIVGSILKLILEIAIICIIGIHLLIMFPITSSIAASLIIALIIAYVFAIKKKSHFFGYIKLIMVT